MNKIKIELNLDNQGLEALLQSMLIKGLQPQAQMLAIQAIEAEKEIQAAQGKDAKTKPTIGFNTGGN